MSQGSKVQVANEKYDIIETYLANVQLVFLHAGFSANWQHIKIMLYSWQNINIIKTKV